MMWCKCPLPRCGKLMIIDPKDIMCAVKSVAQMEIFEGEYTLTDLVMKVSDSSDI